MAALHHQLVAFGDRRQHRAVVLGIGSCGIRAGADRPAAPQIAERSQPGLRHRVQWCPISCRQLGGEPLQRLAKFGHDLPPADGEIGALTRVGDDVVELGPRRFDEQPLGGAQRGDLGGAPPVARVVGLHVHRAMQRWAAGDRIDEAASVHAVQSWQRGQFEHRRREAVRQLVVVAEPFAVIARHHGEPVAASAARRLEQAPELTVHVGDLAVVGPAGVARPERLGRIVRRVRVEQEDPQEPWPWIGDVERPRWPPHRHGVIPRGQDARHDRRDDANDDRGRGECERAPREWPGPARGDQSDAHCRPPPTERR
jgi:hypothetical protein